jgi:hypothetical protein
MEPLGWGRRTRRARRAFAFPGGIHWSGRGPEADIVVVNGVAQRKGYRVADDVQESIH